VHTPAHYLQLPLFSIAYCYATRYIVSMTKQEFDALRSGDIVLSAAGKTWRILCAEANALEPSGRYIYAVRCNAQGTTDGLSNREISCGVAIRNHSAKYTLLTR
jgi:hypothetical protein